jgi:hypothetical protein
MSGSRPLRAAVISRTLVAAGLRRAVSKTTTLRGYREWSVGFQAIGESDGTVVLVYRDNAPGYQARRSAWQQQVRAALADFDVQPATSAAADFVVRRKEAR